ncbi:MAG: DUF5828 family protein [Halobacteriales archaeon]
MEEGVAGFKLSGDWGEIIEHGERITQALREAGADEAYPEPFADWDDWRPKSNELIDAEIREKTADHASVGEGKGEEAGESPNEDVRTAGQRIAESYESLEDDPEGAVEKWQDSVNHVARAADSAGRKALRSVEDTVYRRVMTQIAPYYFDNELVSANVSRTGEEEAPFMLEVNVNDDEFKTEVSDRLASFSEEIDRWHVDSEKRTENAEAAEGVNPPDNEADADARTT